MAPIRNVTIEEHSLLLASKKYIAHIPKNSTDTLPWSEYNEVRSWKSKSEASVVFVDTVVSTTGIRTQKQDEKLLLPART